MAERVGFEPTVHLLGVQPISSRPRYSHFGTSPFRFWISYQFSFLKKNFIRQDLPDYHDFCAFPEERHKLNRPADKKNFLPPTED